MNKKILPIIIFCIVTFTSLFSQSNNPKKGNQLILDRFYELANKNSTEAIALGDSIKLFPSIIKNEKIEFYEILGVTYFGVQNYLNSFIYFNKSLDEAIKQKKYSKAGRIHSDLSNIFLDLNDTISFNKHYKLSISFYEKAKDRDGVLDVIQGRAFFETDHGNYKKSIALLKKHQNEFKQSPDSLLYLVSNYLLLDNYLQIDKKQEAFKHFDTIKSITVNTNADYDYYKNASYMQIADYFFNKNNLDSTNYFLNKFDKSEVEFDSFITIEYYKLLSDFYKKYGNIEMYQKTNDVILSLQQKVILDNSKSEISNEQERVKINDYINENKKNNYKVYVFLFISLVLFAIVAFYSSRKLLKLKKKTKKIVEHLPDAYSLLEEKEKLRIVLNEKNKKLKNFKEEIKSISKVSDSSSQRDKIKSLSKNIILEYSKTDNVESQFEELKLVNQLFFDNLESTFPGLNKIDKIVCFYIHIDFKNKEIAEFLNTSIRSIEGRRYRITKKMSIIIERKTSIKEALSSLILPY